MTAGVLPDGRTQIWGVDPTTFRIWTSWKVSTAHEALWSGWSEFDTNPMAGVNRANSISVSALPDKRLQLFVMQNSSPWDIWTAWKTSTDPNAPWNPLTLL
jgi:hypothetical protein